MFFTVTSKSRRFSFLFAKSKPTSANRKFFELWHSVSIFPAISTGFIYSDLFQFHGRTLAYRLNFLNNRSSLNEVSSISRFIKHQIWCKLWSQQEFWVLLVQFFGTRLPFCEWNYMLNGTTITMYLLWVMEFESFHSIYIKVHQFELGACVREERIQSSAFCSVERKCVQTCWWYLRSWMWVITAEKKSNSIQLSIRQHDN